MEADRIIKESQGGRDIFAYLFPEQENYLDTPKHLFRSPLRDEKQPSAHFIKSSDGVYLLKDFGLMEKSMDAIHAFMKVNGCDFPEAIKRIAEIFNITDEGRGSRKFVNAKYCKRAALPGQTEGTVTTKSFTQSERKFLSPLATDKVLDLLGYESVNQFTKVKDGTEHCCGSYEGYPIFRRHCRMIDAEGNVTNDCHKIYQPRYQVVGKDGKDYKFSYQESGRNPDNIINGLYEIKQSRDADEDKVTAVICCGERDAICVRACGYHPIWFNSESHQITPAEMKLIRKFVNYLYYIPDIDDPGKDAMWRTMKAFPELYVVLLPEEMRKRSGDQHKAMKDLRDWMELHPSAEEFKKLLNTAHQYKIVKYETVSNKLKPQLSADNMLFMLTMNGFGRWYNKEEKQYIYVRLKNKVVSEVTKDDIRTFVTEQIRDYRPNERDAVLGGRAIDNNIQDLPVLDLDFTSANISTQVLFVKDKIWTINPDGIHETDAKEVGYVWEEKVIKHDVTITESIFEYEVRPNPTEPVKTYNHLIVKDDSSKLMQYIIKASCLHWDKLERGVELTPIEEYENNINLQAWLFNIGYLAHRYQRPDHMFAVCMHEYDRFDGIELHGRTGKSFLLDSVFPGMGYLVETIEANDERKLGDKFVYQLVNHKTDILNYDECYKGFTVRRINQEVTHGIQFEEKYKSKQSLSRNNTPKISCLSNYDPVDFDPSTTCRRSMMPISHFFHAKDGYYFKDNRSIADYFGLRVMDDDYPEEDWNRDVNVFMYILSFYLKHMNMPDARRIEAPMTKFLERRNDVMADSPIGPWVSDYFVTKQNCNKEIPICEALENYNLSRRQSGKPEVKKNTFTKQMKDYCSTRSDMELNPLEYCTDKQTRRIRHNNVAYIYVKTTDTEQELPF